MVKITRLPYRQFDPLEFFLKLGVGEKCPSYFIAKEWTVIAWNPDATLSTSSSDAWARLEAFSLSAGNPPQADAPHQKEEALPFSGGIIGYVSYDAGLRLHGIRTTKKSDGMPQFHFHRYGTALLWNGRELFAVGDASFVASVKKIHARPVTVPSVPPIHWQPAMTRATYNAAFTNIQRNVADGEYYQLNLTYPLQAAVSCDSRSLFAHLLRSHPAPSASYIEGEGFSIVSLSPESFLSINNGRVVTSPIKGTRPRGKNPREDRQMKDELLASDKEAAELNMITDLLRNDIGQIAKTGTVRVTDHRLLQKNPSVWHTYSTIEADIDPQFSPLDVLRNMFPGGSVTGCPKVAAMKDIEHLEALPRGPYTGSAVMLSGDRLESSILIRTIVASRRQLSLGIGGGIVADSVCEEEYAETQRKAAPFLALAHGAKKIFINGVVAAFDDPRIAFLDSSNKKVRGVFETMVARDGIIEDLEAHLTRLMRSAKIIGMKLPVSVKKIEAFMKKYESGMPARCSSVRLRRMDKGVLLAVGRETIRLKLVATKHDVIVSLEPLTIDPSHTHGVTAIFIRLDRKNPEAKALPYHREWKAHHTARKKGAAEALLVDRRGFVTEGAYSNLFWVKDGALWTVGDSVLPGITRARVLALAKKLRITLRFGTATPAELLRASEVFMTKSTTEITPILKIDRTLIGRGKVGIVTKRLVENMLKDTES